MLRTHTCGDLRKENAKESVVLCGWVQSVRDLGAMVFLSLRDRYGITQVVFDRSLISGNLHRESVVKVNGKVSLRPEGMRNASMETGDIEVLAEKIEILSEADLLPVEVSDEKVANEEIRLKYRYIDLRRQSLQSNLYMRHKVAQAVRKDLSNQEFIEIQTPLLVRSTPEGARDFVVPSRNSPGKFYALPQSPQLYKQLLMISGFDRYFQLAPCFRDEDARADRQLVHTQIDLEMSFCSEEDIYNVIESVMKAAFCEGIGIDIPTPFYKMTYEDAMNKYGSDKPDLRFDMKMSDLTDLLKDTEFSVFKDTAQGGGRIRGLVAKGCASFTRKEVDELIDLAKIYKAKGLVSFKMQNGELISNISKYISPEILNELIKRLSCEENDLILITSDTKEISAVALGQIRKFLGRKLDLIDKDSYKFLWVTDFPMFEWNEEAQKWDAMHHIFTMPRIEDVDKLESDPGSVLGRLYDLVLNGSELGSGSIRISQPELQKRVMNVIGHDYEDAEKKFGFLLKAYNYGAPTHGGFAVGFDRLIAVMLGLENLRDVIAFPQSASGMSLVDDCPNEIEENQLKEIHIKTI